nr:hypothetical protein [Haloarcula argentinensis]
MTVPAVEDVRDGLASYMETVERAEELEAKIERTDELIDEIDHITDDTFLYQITRADNNGYIDNIQLGVIGISNDSTFRE